MDPTAKEAQVTEIPDDNHVVRLIKAKDVLSEARLDAPPGGVPVDGTAFRAKEKDRDSGVSVNWIEYFCQFTKNEAVQEIWAVQNKKLSLATTHRLALLNVGTTRNHLSSVRRLSFRCEIKTSDDEPPFDPSHAGIHGYTQDDLIVADMIGLTVRAVIEQPEWLTTAIKASKKR